MVSIVLTVMISVMLAGMVALICVDHDSTDEIVNWDGQRSTL